MSEKPASNAGRYWKLIPGFVISGYFLWRTVQGIRMADLRAMHFAHPLWLLALLGFITADYALRGYRSWLMLRVYRAKYNSCCRVLLTSLAANNILPFRIGDFMRIFAYAPDVNAPSSAVFSTVLLERLLDVVMLLAFLVAGILGIENKFSPVSVHGHHFGVLHLAVLILVCAGAGLGLLLFGTRLLHRMTAALVARYGNHPRTQKAGEWATLLFDAVLHMSFLSRVWIVVLTAVVWMFEVLVFYSAARILSINTLHGSLLAGTLSNLSFLLPSAPGGIGPFEASSKLAMETQGIAAGDAALYALFAHVVIFLLITVVGGIGFLIHRKERGSLSKPLGQDLAALPVLEVPEI